MEKGEFFRLNKELEKNDSKLLANPRNSASGSLRTLVPLQNRKLHFFAYQLFNSALDSQFTCLRELEKLGFAVSPDYQSCKGIEKTKEFIQKHEPKRLNLDFESDGIVVKVNNYDFYPSLGQTSQVSRNGRITYVAEIKPVTLQGSTISKVTLHNYSFIRNLKLNIGDKVAIKKAGDVIPQIIQLIKLTENIWLPPNAYIKGLSQKNIEKLYQNSLIKKPIDFYQLDQKREELLKLEGFQKKSIDNILSSIENSKKKPLTNLLIALGIPLLSSVKAKKLSIFYPNLASIRTIIENNE
ncbi:4281_t:CDS:2 [Funneliformis geosporum]|uniref:DNA ligase (NAD(+)) n=1 Tax=Funneliformis geosporum TaxID=1117311 RepID=A0A9W4SY03_9GLOM|nr:4281_t:CDS:2 [Funneliformis geosporum]